MEGRLLEIQDLDVIYETDEGIVYAVSGLDLTLNKGETLGLVGETGAGKTTTALSIMRLLPDRIGFIRKGKIELNGIDITRATEADMRSIRGEVVSMIFQDPMTSLNPLMSIGDQINEALLLHRIDMSKEARSARVDEMLTLIGIPPDRKDEYPHQFSGGMKQRIVIAMALACEPMLLLADEPTTALDVTIQAQVLVMMNNLKESLNTAMILITHDLGVVAQTCDRVAVMYAGEIVEIGAVADIFESEIHHPYTTGLFGSIPSMNVVTRRLSPIEGLMPDPKDPPKGCRFHERCSQCMDICKSIAPKTHYFDGHGIRCHLFE
jgi:peptide/nickel transport system ATP-binding protein